MDADFAEASVLARIDEAACIGCTLAPCPVDCIALVPRDRPWTAADAARAQAHFNVRAARLARLPDGREAKAASHAMDEDALRARRRAAVAAALARARARRSRLRPVERRS